MLNCIEFTKNKMKKKKKKNKRRKPNKKTQKKQSPGFQDLPFRLPICSRSTGATQLSPVVRGGPWPPHNLPSLTSLGSHFFWSCQGPWSYPAACGQGTRGPGMASAPGLGMGSVEGWRKWILGCWASRPNLNFQFFHACLLPWLPSPPVSCHLCRASPGSPSPFWFANHCLRTLGRRWSLCSWHLGSCSPGPI